MKNDIGYFYDTEAVLDLEHFVELLLVSLAKKDILYDARNVVIATLSTNYKEVIETIMYAQNGWGINFSKLIDIDEYYEHQADWEFNLSCAFQKYVTSRNKKIDYHFEYDYLEFKYTKEEIIAVLANYDKKAIEKMDHFANLVHDFGLNRLHDLHEKEAQRSVQRELIRTGDCTWSKSWK